MASKGLNLSFVLDYPEELTDLNRLYGDVEELAVGEIISIVHDEVLNRTPRDDVTKRGKAKSQSEHIQANWSFEMETGNRGATIENPFVYGPVLEEGRYRGVGPRTKAGEGGIYSRQAPKGIIKPLIEDDSIIKDAIDMVVVKLKERLDRIRSG